MRTEEVLGVDLTGDRVCVVQLRRPTPGGSAAVLTHWAQAKLPAGAGGAEIAATLRQLLSEHGFTAGAAALSLPPGHGFLQCRAAPAGDEGDLDPFGPAVAADYVTDAWTTSDGREVRGVASRAGVTQVLQIAAGASLYPLGIELRAMGTLRSLGLLEGGQARASLGLVMSDAGLTGALVDGEAVLAVHTRRPPPGGSGPVERREIIIAEVERMVRLLCLGSPDVSASTARAIVPDAARDALSAAGDRLGVSVEFVPPGRDAGLQVQGDLDDPATYAPAIGLALEAMARLTNRGKGRSVRGLDFLRPARRRRRRMPRVTWRRVAMATGIAAAILLAVGIGLAWNTQSVLTDRAEKYEALAPRLAERQKALRRWQRLRPWVAVEQGGTRVAYRKAVYALAKLFPPVTDAYVPSVTFTPVRGGDGAEHCLVAGRAQGDDVLNDFVARLNASELFEGAELGTVNDVADGNGFPKEFTLTFKLTRRP